MTKEFKFIAGHYYRLTKDVNRIPAGTYRFAFSHGDSLVFDVGKRTSFMMSDDGQEFFEPAPSAATALKKTTSADFLKRYYHLLETQNS